MNARAGFLIYLNAPLALLYPKYLGFPLSSADLWSMMIAFVPQVFPVPMPHFLKSEK